jgi:hypothetical protein
MSKLHQWVNTGLLFVCAAALVGIWHSQARDIGVQCLDQNHPALQHLHIDRPGYCVAVAPAYLDRD